MGLKQGVKHATLNYGHQESFFDGLELKFRTPQEVVYREVMGREPPPPFEEGTLAYEQWEYRKDSRKRAADVLAHPKAKPLKKKPVTRRGRKPKGV